jgi:hypothetical protein
LRGADDHQILGNQVAVEDAVIGHRVDQRHVDRAFEHRVNECLGLSRSDRERQVREHRRQAGYQWRSEHIDGRLRQAQPNAAFDLRHRCSAVLHGEFELPQWRGRRGAQSLALIGQLHSPVGSAKQADAEILFEQANLTVQHRLSKAQRSCCSVTVAHGNTTIHRQRAADPPARRAQARGLWGHCWQSAVFPSGKAFRLHRLSAAARRPADLQRGLHLHR